MRKTEAGKSEVGAQRALSLLLGALLALGIALIILLIGSVAVSAGILRADSSAQVTAAACLLGCLAGGGFTVSRWRSQRLIAGLLTGIFTFVLILILALINGRIKFGAQALIELAACLVGGGLAGVLMGKRKKKKRKSR